MPEFLSVLSTVFNVLFIVSAITFGISLAVKTLLIQTVKKINKESSKNFDKISDFEIKSNTLSSINSLTVRYVNHSQEVQEIKRTNRKNKVRKLLKLKEYKVGEKTDNIKDIFLSLFKVVSYKVDGKGGYLNFSKNELFSMIRELLDRVETILDSSKVIWLKSVKISSFIEIVKIYGSIEKFTSKPSVILVTYLINFCLSVSKFFSPIGATKKLAGSVLDDSFSSILATTVISVIGKEWAVLCYEKELSRQLDNKKVA